MKKIYGYFHGYRARTSDSGQPLAGTEIKHHVEILETINGIESKSAMNPSDISTKKQKYNRKTLP